MALVSEVQKSLAAIGQVWNCEMRSLSVVELGFVPIKRMPPSASHPYTGARYAVSPMAWSLEWTSRASG